MSMRPRDNCTGVRTSAPILIRTKLIPHTRVSRTNFARHPDRGRGEEETVAEGSGEVFMERFYPRQTH